MSAENTTFYVVMGVEVSKEGAVDEAGGESKLSNGWRLMVGAPTWIVAKYRACMGVFLEHVFLVEYFLMEEALCY